jgi:hypothetical protein
VKSAESRPHNINPSPLLPTNNGCVSKRQRERMQSSSHPLMNTKQKQKLKAGPRICATTTSPHIDTPTMRMLKCTTRSKKWRARDPETERKAGKRIEEWRKQTSARARAEKMPRSRRRRPPHGAGKRAELARGCEVSALGTVQRGNAGPEYSQQYFSSSSAPPQRAARLD